MSFATHEMLRDDPYVSEQPTMMSNYPTQPTIMSNCAYGTPYGGINMVDAPMQYGAALPAAYASAYASAYPAAYGMSNDSNELMSNVGSQRQSFDHRHNKVFGIDTEKASVLPFQGGENVTMQIVDTGAKDQKIVEPAFTIVDSKKVARDMATRFVKQSRGEVSPQVPADVSHAVSDRLDVLERSVDKMHVGLMHHTDKLNTLGGIAREHEHELSLQSEGLLNHADVISMQHEGLRNHTDVLKMQHEGLRNHTDVLKMQSDGLSNHTASLKNSLVAIKQQHEGLLHQRGELRQLKMNNPYITNTDESFGQTLKSDQAALKNYGTTIMRAAKQGRGTATAAPARTQKEVSQILSDIKRNRV